LEIKTIDILKLNQGRLMSHAFKKTRVTPARAREIELIQARLAALSEIESTLERDKTTLYGLRAVR
jgi:hypothetical protein